MRNHPAVTPAEHAAMLRLLDIASGDTGQGRAVASLLLAWWDARTCGAFDLTDLWAVDAAIAADMVAVVALAARCQHYPDTLGYGQHFARVLAAWRPGLSE